MTTLTLPIVVGKKYVRRDGVVVEAKPYGTEDSPIKFACVATGSEPQDDDHAVFRQHGCTWTSQDSPTDLVSDYIEPAKGHPHAALMAQFAEDASKSETPWDQWEMLDTHGEWFDMTRPPEWHITSHYRRRPTPTPDPHAENAAEYAKDMALSDKAWEGWEFRPQGSSSWEQQRAHPFWSNAYEYRRKVSL